MWRTMRAWPACKEKPVILLFIFSIIFFSYQFYRGAGWDFAAYVLNAKYLFASGHYFELLRPPLAPAMLGIFGTAFGFAAAPYLYIIISAALHLYSCSRVSKAFGIDFKNFYLLSATPFFLFSGMQQGTEVLSVALLQLFLAEIFSGKNAGVFFGLSILARYTNAVFFPILLFRKDLKLVMRDIFFAALVAAPWLLYNDIVRGNALASVADFYALNVLSRAQLVQPANIIHFVYALGFLSPLFLFGAAKSVKGRRTDKKDLAMLLFAAIVALSYITSPFKLPRFLFAIIIPAAYFSVHALSHAPKHAPAIVAALAVLGSAVAVFALLNQPQDIDVSPAFSSMERNCSYMSNYWVYLDYAGYSAMPAPREADAAKHYLSGGQRLLFFSGVGDPAYGENRTLLRAFGVIEETPEYIMLGNKSVCAPTRSIDASFAAWADENSRAAGGPGYETDPYLILLWGRFAK